MDVFLSGTEHFHGLKSRPAHVDVDLVTLMLIWL
jgi:hypothetical protein